MFASSTGHYTFTNPGEQVLDRWMREHAFVTWVEVDSPHELEAHFLASGLRLPLDIERNPRRTDAALVSAIRAQARRAADAFEIVVDSGGPCRS